jgi:tryptophan synthase alpha chain
MNYNDKFQELATRKEKAFIPFTVIGDPDYKTSLKVIKAMVDGGADILELGVPFSDPIADGPTIQAADTRSISNGFDTDSLFKLVREVRKFTNIPIGLLVYANMVIQRKTEIFFKDAKHAGVNGILIADMPVEESEEIISLANEYDLETIFIVSPLTSNDRLSHITKATTGFVYVVSRLGVTGVQNDLQDGTIELLERIKPLTDLPLCVGFGISKPEHVKSVCKAGADGAIVGSALVKIIENNLSDKNSMLRQIKDYVMEMKQATKS